jgi:enoyl-CoA hydratase
VPIMAGLKEIYVTGSSAVAGPALAAEQAIAGAQEPDRDGLGARYAEITERNRRQIRPQP